jgi:hypothetical protein
MELHPTCELNLKVIEFENKNIKIKIKGFRNSKN